LRILEVLFEVILYLFIESVDISRVVELDQELGIGGVCLLRRVSQQEARCTLPDKRADMFNAVVA